MGLIVAKRKAVYMVLPFPLSATSEYRTIVLVPGMCVRCEGQISVLAKVPRVVRAVRIRYTARV